jgi:hypothetical protein
MRPLLFTHIVSGKLRRQLLRLPAPILDNNLTAAVGPPVTPVGAAATPAHTLAYLEAIVALMSTEKPQMRIKPTIKPTILPTNYAIDCKIELKPTGPHLRVFSLRPHHGITQMVTSP